MFAIHKSPVCLVSRCGSVDVGDTLQLWKRPLNRLINTFDQSGMNLKKKKKIEILFFYSIIY